MYDLFSLILFPNTLDPDRSFRPGLFYFSDPDLFSVAIRLLYPGRRVYFGNQFVFRQAI
jgi:hypothetical protein